MDVPHGCIDKTPSQLQFHTHTLWHLPRAAVRNSASGTEVYKVYKARMEVQKRVTGLSGMDLVALPTTPIREPQEA